MLQSHVPPSMQRTGKHEHRIKELDALRGIAAVFVVLFHYTLYKHPSEAIFKFGVTGVELFFIISGFVILMTLEKTRHWRDFVVSRFARLFPGYWTCVSLTAIAVLCVRLVSDKSAADLLGTYAGNLTMFQYYLRIPNLDESYWTMILEMIFYIFMLGLFQFNLLRKTEIIACAILAFCAVYCYIGTNASFTQITKIIGWGLPIVHYFPLFVAGISFYRVRHRQNTIFNSILLPVCLVVQVLLYNNAVALHFRTGFLTTPEYIGVLTLYFSLFTLYIANSLPFIANRITIFLGGISYALYLVHQFLGTHILIPSFQSLNLGYAAAAVASLAVVITIAWLITYYVEKPAMKYIKTVYKNRKAAAQPAGAKRPASARNNPAFEARTINEEHN